MVKTGCLQNLLPNAAPVYPDGATPPPPPPFHSHRRVKPFRCYLVFLFIFIITAATFAFFIIYLPTTIRGDDATRPDFQIDAATITTPDLTSATGPNLTFTLDLTFTLANPNNNSNISYEIIVVSLDSDGDCAFPTRLPWPHICSGFLAANRFPPFLQLNRSANTVPIQINVVNQFVAGNRRGIAGSMEFGLTFYARLRIDGGVSIMYFYCERLSFVFESKNDTSAAASENCLSKQSFFFW